MNEASRYSFNEAAGHYAGSDGEPCTADEVVAAHVYDALRARLAEAERLMQEGGGLLNLLNHGTESVEGCPFCDHSRAVGLYLPRASETGCAAHTENNQ